MKWMTVLFVLLAIWTIAAAAPQKKYGQKQCGGKKCLENLEEIYRRKRQHGLSNKSDLKRHKRSQDELKAVEDAFTDQQKQTEKVRNLRPGKLWGVKEVEEEIPMPENPVLVHVQKRTKNAEKWKVMEELEKQKAERRRNREKPADSSKMKQKTKKGDDESLDTSRMLSGRKIGKNIEEVEFMELMGEVNRLKRNVESDISDPDFESEEVSEETPPFPEAEDDIAENDEALL